MDAKVKAKMAETRRQIIGICRKVPSSVVDYFQNLANNDSMGSQASFTLANLRCIKGKLQEDVFLAVVKRMVHFYESCLPTPKAIQPKAIPDEIVSVRRALAEIAKFKDLCEYPCMPQELSVLLETLLCTQRLDEELADNATKYQLLPSIVQGCRDLVPNGTMHLETAEKKISDELSDRKSDDDTGLKEPNESELTTGIDMNMSQIDENSSGSKAADVHSEVPEDPTRNSDLSERDQQDCIGFTGSATERNRGSAAPESLVTVATVVQPNQQEGCRDTTVDNQSKVSESTTVDKAESILPRGWKLVNSSFEAFATQNESWKCVQGKVDLVMMQLSPEENNETKIKEAVRHAGVAMKLTGVTHVFCTHLQFAKVCEAAMAEGMDAMKYPMIYLEEPSTTKKRTLKQRPQENSKPAAVFWRSPDPGTKHHFSFDWKYSPSSTPAWTNSVTNVLPPSEKLKGLGRCTVTFQDWNKEVISFILKQWCQPAGLCYNPLPGPMGAALACYDLGIQYVGVEEDDFLFEAGAQRLLDYVRPPHKKLKRPRLDSQVPKSDRSCSIGQQLCKYKNLKATYKFQGCGKPMHDLCDYAKIFTKVPIEDRGLVSACSQTCFENTT